ncbi:MAG: glutaredoxin family protein [Solirubrobacteraceae bacterium]
MEVILLTQEACAFCDQAKAMLGRLVEDYPITVRLIGLDTPDGERMALSAGVLFPPGIIIDGEPFSYGRPSERKLRRALRSRLATT